MKECKQIQSLITWMSTKEQVLDLITYHMDEYEGT